MFMVVKGKNTLHQASVSKVDPIEESPSAHHSKPDYLFENQWSGKRLSEQDLKEEKLGESQLTVLKDLQRRSLTFVCRESLNIRLLTFNRKHQFFPCARARGNSGDIGFCNEERILNTPANEDGELKRIEQLSCTIGGSFSCWPIELVRVLEVTVNAAEGEGTWKWTQ
jgi:hypothetical protein